MKKPTIEQVAWVFEKIVANAKKYGSFRQLIYGEMEFDADAYTPLYVAGGMAINNAMFSEYTHEGDVPTIR